MLGPPEAMHPEPCMVADSGTRGPTYHTPDRGSSPVARIRGQWGLWPNGDHHRVLHCELHLLDYEMKAREHKSKWEGGDGGMAAQFIGGTSAPALARQAG
jgi:hypothetical protein